ncbi:MAG: SigE family RNA polymerase sigma factor [Hamadaea sp.]|uniref:SigE family RNA polymerase sigma factor n=1 Tax=Hamadaea sp. TaxID=2024425 RepID=UPI00182752C9|nr:SigE family RNA polymerase sigma factor [Hamadaea sp.]NUR74102.1 SigE family RNA polymerase sigma factor [Hamadaea sp.]NUT19991.1 SigE family RNA polymerase sigma factor [Hamadaea sp.]
MDGSEEFDEFYRGTAQRLVRYAYGLTADPAEAQDLAQEAYARAWHHWKRVRAYDLPEAWLRTVVTRLATDRWRRISLRRTRPQPVLEATPPPGDDRMFVASLLVGLPLEQRRAMALHYLSDLSVDQVAAEMKANPNTVKSWLSRGRAALAARLAEQGEIDVY